ncbi:MAG TPA: hypothetical protein DD409_03845 [Bacteroidales bacterium]|nr:hypothetical protein [Bacteroidales bacterium]
MRGLKGQEPIGYFLEEGVKLLAGKSTHVHIDAFHLHIGKLLHLGREAGIVHHAFPFGIEVFSVVVTLVLFQFVLDGRTETGHFRQDLFLHTLGDLVGIFGTDQLVENAFQGKSLSLYFH